MSKKLEETRQDKIKDLNMMNSKEYINNLNLKRFHSNTKAEYDEQLINVFEMAEDKFDNLKLFSKDIDLYSVNPNLLIFTLKSEILAISYTSLILNNGILTIKSNINALKSLMLEDDIDFNINQAIGQLIQNVEFLVQSLAHFVELHDEQSIDDELGDADIERSFIIGLSDVSENIRSLKESEYFDLMEVYVQVLNSLKGILKDYRLAHSEFLSLINDFLIERKCLKY